MRVARIVTLRCSHLSLSWPPKNKASSADWKLPSFACSGSILPTTVWPTSRLQCSGRTLKRSTANDLQSHFRHKDIVYTVQFGGPRQPAFDLKGLSTVTCQNSAWITSQLELSWSYLALDTADTCWCSAKPTRGTCTRRKPCVAESRGTSDGSGRKTSEMQKMAQKMAMVANQSHISIVIVRAPVLCCSYTSHNLHNLLTLFIYPVISDPSASCALLGGSSSWCNSAQSGQMNGSAKSREKVIPTH